ncbi:Arylsulfatase [Planctomycetes bacterium CA13]|uniref:Arylsulfatase n=1 Tax=Novipirellula herctigrandis TaxID=2527986 RepID=A0A5C5YWU7_9BACT|nr:Arylsulfatase [Planctomycetes bacterium CA13]
MKRFLSLLLVFALAVDSFAAAANASGRRPNILLVMADDMGWTDLGRFGSEIATPNLDRLAKRGLTFTDFHVSVSCSPTRSMLLSGNDNHIVGLGNMGELLTEHQKGRPGYEGYLNDRVVSLAETLLAGGYHTYMAGKWHLGHKKGNLPFDRGFERTFSLLVGGASHWGDRLGLLPSDDPAEYSKNGAYLEELPENFYSSRSYADFLMESIRSNQGDGKPFLAYLAFTAPHDPVHVPEPWLSKYRGKYDQGYGLLKKQRWEAAKKLGIVPQDAELAAVHPLLKEWSELSDDERAMEARGMEVYAGMLEAMDYHYGRVIDFLKDIGEYENTIVIFLSDNGPNPWYSDEYPGAADPSFKDQFDNRLENIGHPRSNYAYGIGFGSASAGPLNKFKMTVGEGGIRSPFLIAGPGVKGGRQIDAFAYVTDVMPTILELASVSQLPKFKGSTMEPMRGRSLVGLLDGSSKAVYGPEEFVGGEMGGGKWMRQGDLKAVIVPKPYGTGEWSLHDVAKDPGEAKDLSADMPERLNQLMAAWNDYAKEVGIVPAE